MILSILGSSSKDPTEFTSNMEKRILIHFKLIINLILKERQFLPIN